MAHLAPWLFSGPASCFRREEQLESRIAEVNRRIAAGENGHFAFIRHGRHARWTLRYPCESELLNHPFFDQLKQVEISSILHFVNRQCRFMNAFEHVLGRYAKQEADDHSTDTHGTNEVNFALLHLFGYNSRPATRICTIKSALPCTDSNTRAVMVMQSSGRCERLGRSSSSTNEIMSNAFSCPWRSKPQPKAPSSAS